MATIKLNVGGKLFETNLDTIQQSSYLKCLIKYDYEKDKVIFIDRSYHIFKHVISLLRNPEYKYPSKYKDELDFYGIDIPMNLCDSDIDKLSIICKTIKKTLNNYTNDTTHDLEVLHDSLNILNNKIKSFSDCWYKTY